MDEPMAGAGAQLSGEHVKSETERALGSCRQQALGQPFNPLVTLTAHVEEPADHGSVFRPGCRTLPVA